MNSHVDAPALPRSVLSRIGDAVRAFCDILADSSTGMACAREADRLFALSDEELARLGLTRDRVINHAFRRYLAV
jgi:hypothetical protein